jgi:hypothetical protein
MTSRVLIEVARQLGGTRVRTDRDQRHCCSHRMRPALKCGAVNKVTEGRPHIVDMIKNNEIALVINTVEERRNAIR